LKVGLWKEDKNQTVCYRHIKIVDPYMFTKNVTTERNLVNGEKDYIIPDKLLAVGPNNELIYFKVEHKSNLMAQMQKTYK
jgi:hypothetical protein